MLRQLKKEKPPLGIFENGTFPIYKKQLNALNFQNNRPEATLNLKYQEMANKSISSNTNLYNNNLKRNSAAIGNTIQGAFIAIIGKEEPINSDTLKNGAEKLLIQFGEKEYYDEVDIKSGNFKTPTKDETIYLIAHGDNTAISLTKEAALGDKNGTEVKNIVKKILQKFKKHNKGEPFSGKIILEGCHSAEPVVREDGRVKKGSMLYDMQQAMNGEKFFKNILAPEVMIGGYLGQAFSSGDYNTGYGTANTEHPLTKRFQKSRGVFGIEEGGGISYNNKESFIESRWRQELPFGKPKKQKK